MTPAEQTSSVNPRRFSTRDACILLSCSIGSVVLAEFTPLGIHTRRSTFEDVGVAVTGGPPVIQEKSWYEKKIGSLKVQDVILNFLTAMQPAGLLILMLHYIKGRRSRLSCGEWLWGIQGILWFFALGGGIFYLYFGGSLLQGVLALSGLIALVASFFVNFSADGCRWADRFGSIVSMGAFVLWEFVGANSLWL